MMPFAFTSFLFFLIVDFTDTSVEVAIAGGFVALVVVVGAMLDQWLERKVSR